MAVGGYSAALPTRPAGLGQPAKPGQTVRRCMYAIRTLTGTAPPAAADCARVGEWARALACGLCMCSASRSSAHARPRARLCARVFPRVCNSARACLSFFLKSARKSSNRSEADVPDCSFTPLYASSSRTSERTSCREAQARFGAHQEERTRARARRQARTHTHTPRTHTIGIANANANANANAGTQARATTDLPLVPWVELARLEPRKQHLPELVALRFLTLPPSLHEHGRAIEPSQPRCICGRREPSQSQRSVGRVSADPAKSPGADVGAVGRFPVQG